MNQFLVSSVRQHSLNALFIAIGNQHVNIEVTLPLVSLFGQDVSRMRVAALDLAGRGHAKSLGRAFVCL